MSPFSHSAAGSSSQSSGSLLAVLSATCYGIGAVFAGCGLSLGAGAGAVSLIRGLSSLTGAAFLCRFSGVTFRIGWRRFGRILLCLSAGAVPTSILLNISYQYMPVGTVTSIHFLYPVLVTLADLLFFGIQPGRRGWICLAAATLGVLLFISPGGQFHLPGFLLALSTAVFWAVHILLLGHSRLSQENPLLLSVFQASLQTVVSLGICSMENTCMPPLTAITILIIAGLVGNLMGTVLFQNAVIRIGDGRAAILSVLEPVSSIIFGLLLLGEVISRREMLACTLILLSVLFLSLPSVGGQRPADK